MTDNGELWRGWDLATGGGTWTQVLLAGIPTVEIIDLFNQGYGDVKGILVNRQTSTGTQWYYVKSNAQVLANPVSIGNPNAKQIVWVEPLNEAINYVALNEDGTLSSNLSLDASVTSRKYTKIFGGPFRCNDIVGLREDTNQLEIVYSNGAALQPIPLPDGETGVRDFIYCGNYVPSSLCQDQLTNSFQ